MVLAAGAEFEAESLHGEVLGERIPVNRLGVIDVHEVLGDEFPVALEVECVFVRDHGLSGLARLGADVHAIVVEELLEADRIGIEIDEDVAFPRIELHLVEAAVLEVEGLLDFLVKGCTDELAVEVVKPPMVGAAEFLGIAVADGRHLDAAVTADVGEGVELALLVLADNDRLAGDAHGRVVARLRKLFGAADAQPILHEYLFDLFVEDVPRGVHVPGQMARPMEVLARRR